MLVSIAMEITIQEPKKGIKLSLPSNGEQM